MTDYSLDIQSLRKSYLQGTLTPTQVMQNCLARIKANAASNAWIQVLSEVEVAQYLSGLKEKPIEDYPLWGIPFAIKDNIDLEGVPTTAACPAYRYSPPASAFVVQRLIAAGAIPLGKTNLDQFATGLVGTRSPYGEVPNSFNADYISGGSSSGSAFAVATGQVSFSLGTDTAGSGRIPAAFNNLWGCKPSKGLLSIRGVVPACRSLDCVTFFSLSAQDSRTLLTITAAVDKQDPFSRSKQFPKGLASSRMKIGVPSISALNFFGDAEYAAQFELAKTQMLQAGATLVEIDFTSFAQAAQLLYEGPWLTERYVAVGEFIEAHPDAVLDVTRSIIDKGKDLSAVDTFRGFYRLQTLKLQADAQLAEVDAILIPTAGTCYRRAQVAAEPVVLNSNLGYYTNFMNLLDYAALAIPAGFTPKGLPFGITLFAPAFCDERLLDIGERFSRQQPLAAGAMQHIPTNSLRESPGVGYIAVAVCGAHLQGLALNWQLTQRNAVLLESIRSAARYRFYALPGGPPYRPGLVRVAKGGTAIAMEIWAVPEEQFGSFVAGIPAPLGIGKVELENGRWVSGFICEPIGLEGAIDISSFADWRIYLHAENSKQDS